VQGENLAPPGRGALVHSSSAGARSAIRRPARRPASPTCTADAPPSSARSGDSRTSGNCHRSGCRGLHRVRLPADLLILAELSCALNRGRAMLLACVAARSDTRPAPQSIPFALRVRCLVAPGACRRSTALRPGLLAAGPASHSTLLSIVGASEFSLTRLATPSYRSESSRGAAAPRMRERCGADRAPPDAWTSSAARAGRASITTLASRVRSSGRRSAPATCSSGVPRAAHVFRGSALLGLVDVTP
jgi:hypothetical protein